MHSAARPQQLERVLAGVPRAPGPTWSPGRKGALALIVSGGTVDVFRVLGARE